MEDLNTVNDVQEPNVEAQQTDLEVETADEMVDTEAHQQEPADPAPRQTPQENAAFKAMRQQSERKLAEAEAERERLEQQFATQLQMLKTNDPEIVRMREENEAMHLRMMEDRLRSDLAEIRRHNPGETVKDIRELGMDFLTMRANGVSLLAAYEAVRLEAARKAPPPSMGDLGGAKVEAPANRYAAMSDADFEKAVLAAERGELKKGN